MAKFRNMLYLLWDESHLWAVMLTRALRELEAPFRIVSARDVKDGILEQNPPAGLLVPGGWARLKAECLEKTGRKHIREYIHSGGKYLGLCGGAGLALKSTPGWPALDLCPWGRKPIKNRLPNFSGHVVCGVKPCSPAQEQNLSLPVWWPSQFEPCSDPDYPVEIVARYLEPGMDFWSSDLILSQVDQQDLDKWENVYGINLNFDNLSDEPCIIRGRQGLGEYILSYSHLETPDSPQANRLLADILNCWLPSPACALKDKKVSSWDLQHVEPSWEEPILLNSRSKLNEIISLGQSQFLLFWRTPWLLGWRRGIPGSPLNFLYALIAHALQADPGSKAKEFWDSENREFNTDMELFHKELKSYLSHERLAIAMAPSSPEASSDQDLQQLKQKLFGKFPGYGGLYKKLVKRLDSLIFWLENK